MSGYRSAEGRVGNLSEAERIAGEPYADVRVRYLYEIGELFVEDGDIVVLFSEQRLNREWKDQIVAELKLALPAGTPVLVLDAGMKIGVLHGKPEIRLEDLCTDDDEADG